MPDIWQPMFIPLWAALAVLSVKLIEWLITKLRYGRLERNDTFGAINQAHKNLSDAMFQHVTLLQGDVARQRMEIEEWQKKHEALEAELAELKKAISP